MNDENIRIAGSNLYKITYTIGKGDSTKLVVAYSAQDVEAMYRGWDERGTLIIELIERDISMIILGSALPKIILNGDE